MARSPVVAHRHLALVFCDSAGSLAEVLAQVDLRGIPHQRFGERAVALPATHAVVVRDALREAGSFPRIVGELRRPGEVDAEEANDE